MISQKGYLLLIAFCACISLAYSQTYSFTIMTNGTCEPVKEGQCVPCQYTHYYPVSYYKIANNGNGFTTYEYSDSACTSQLGFSSSFTGNCNNEFYGNCYFFAKLESTEVLTLSLTSKVDDIVVNYFGENYYAKISPNKVYAQGQVLQGFQIHSDNEVFWVERLLSETQYSTNIGIFNIGETYVRDPFTFEVTTETIKFPLDLGKVEVLSLEPFTKATVIGPNEYQTYHGYEGQLNLYVNDIKDGRLRGFAVGNPYFSLYNMSIYEDFGSSDYATLVFQLEPSLSPFYTLDCRQYESGSGGTQVTEYDCNFGSLDLSGLPEGSWSNWGEFSSFGYSASYWSSTSSFNRHQNGSPKKVNPDNMAFALF